MPPRPSIPPLPAPVLFSKPHLFPRKYYPQAADPMTRSLPGRQIIASRRLADEFVQALDLQEGEVVLECFPGHGQVTRSLLRGGRLVPEQEEWESWEEWERDMALRESSSPSKTSSSSSSGASEGSGTAESKEKGKVGVNDKAKAKAKGKGKDVFPWTQADLSCNQKDAGKPHPKSPVKQDPGPSQRSYHVPPRVVALEPSYTLLTRSLGPADEMAEINAMPNPKEAVSPAVSQEDADAAAAADTDADADSPLAQSYFVHNAKGNDKTPVNQSIHHPDLILSNSSAYAWNAVPIALEHPLVAPYVPKRPWTEVASQEAMTAIGAPSQLQGVESNPGIPTEGPEAEAEVAKRPFTLVAHVPDSLIGEQLVSQWIGCSTGTAHEDGSNVKRQWIWQWGRARLALVVQRNIYDRLMAKPGEAGVSRLSILTSALFHRSPLPPYHHVANVDKTSHRTFDTPIGYAGLAKVAKAEHRPLGERAKGKGGAKARGKGGKSAVEVEAADAEGVEGESDLGPRSYPYTHRPSLYSSYLRPVPPPTKVQEAEFYPMPARSSAHLYQPSAPILDRPHFLGIQLVPRVKSPVTAEQKDAWDYVLRNMFVLINKPVEEAIGLLGFAAEGLLGKIEEKQAPEGDEGEDAAEREQEGSKRKKKRRPWKGEEVDRKTIVRDLTVEQWARIVDVFDRWAFRPQNLLIDPGSSHEIHRELGVD